MIYNPFNDRNCLIVKKRYMESLTKDDMRSCPPPNGLADASHTDRHTHTYTHTEIHISIQTHTGTHTLKLPPWIF
jgi:hypothetical protein